MDPVAIISLLAFGLSFATFIVIRLNRRDEIADEIAYGDWPHLSEGLAAPGDGRAGGGPGRPSAAVTRTKKGQDRTHGRGTA